MEPFALHEIATGRSASLFSDDIKHADEILLSAIAGKRILAIGGAGSIGSSTVAHLAARRPDALHIIDQNENGLAELVRQLRSSPHSWSARDFQTLPLDYGSGTMRLFLASQPTYDLVLNFAALKHVRSEKDPFSALQIFDTNLLKQTRFMKWLAETGFSGRFFTVSTDKAANPSSMMGATKRLMEHVLFNSTTSHALSGVKTSARFANVAFSNGSLLQSFQNRLARGEPLAVPIDTRRYFVSLQESGEICALSAAYAPDKAIVIPKLSPQDHLIQLQEIAEKFLKIHGFKAKYYNNEISACSDVENERKIGNWPLLLTPLDTAGEKPYEEFLTDQEQSFEIGLPNLRAVAYQPAETKRIDNAIRMIAEIIENSDPIDKNVLKDIVASIEPNFKTTHRESNSNLDQRI